MKTFLYNYIADNYGEEFFEKIWSDKNTVDKTVVTYKCGNILWWKCPDGVHDDYERKCSTATRYHYRCPKCSKEKMGLKMRHDIAGQHFNMLTPKCIDEAKTKELGKTYWLCQCDCGNPQLKSIYHYHITSGATRSCGCLEHPSGENNWNWKGGITPERQRARERKEYKDWQQAVYKKDWYTCQCCGKSHSIEKQAHHLINFTNNINLRYDVNNGITLCRDCHYTTIQGSFHNTYGTVNNTPEQLEKYINDRRKQLGINIPFSIQEYLNGNILKPQDINLLKTS